MGFAAQFAIAARRASLKYLALAFSVCPVVDALVAAQLQVLRELEAKP